MPYTITLVQLHENRDIGSENKKDVNNIQDDGDCSERQRRRPAYLSECVGSGEIDGGDYCCEYE